MTLSDRLEGEMMRTRVALMAMLAAFAFLGAVLWRIQVFSTLEYGDSLDRQSIRLVRLPAARGAILERNGICLAHNRPSYNIAVYVEELRKPGRMSNTVNEVERVIRRVGGIVGAKPEVTRGDILMHVKKRLPLPFLAWRDIDQKTLARWCESNVSLPAVDIYIEPVRSYPMGSLAAHVMGYVGRAAPGIEAEEGEETYHYYLPEMAGSYGVEKTFNERLAGEAGKEAIRVDASGFKHETLKSSEPIPGRDVSLTLDFRLQRLVEEALGDERGAAVILDPRNGDVLAMASSPFFDPNRFGAGMSREEWAELHSSESHPMVNRAIQGTYAPGSVFKPIVVLAALESGTANENTRFNCPGYFQLGAVRFHCWQKDGHGIIAMRKGIEQSCNAYFCQLGMQCGVDQIAQTAKAVGLGKPTGIDLGSESGLEAGGVLPDRAWKLKRLNEGWWPGDTCNLSIGQGALTATPLQMASVTATIANGGFLYRPRILLKPGQKGELAARMGWSAGSLRIVRGGMHDVIEAESGTGKRAKVEGVEMAGKTGTADFGIKAERKKYTWMTVFAPFDAPRYAVAMVIEEGVSGGQTVAPRIGRLMTGIFRLEGMNVRKAGAEG